MTTATRSKHSRSGMKTSDSGRRRLLMARPEGFTVRYVINPWMEGNEDRAHKENAIAQWEALHAVLSKIADVDVLPAADGLPDFVFTANAAIVLNGRAVVTRFRPRERRGEEPIFEKWFVDNGFDVVTPPEGIAFEGAGDALADRVAPILWVGYGQRSSFEAAEFLSRALDVEVIPLRLVDERFYHLDTAFCPLEGGWLLYHPAAFDEASQRRIAERIPEDKRLVVSERDALHFACNAVNVGKDIVLNAATPELRARLRDAGFTVYETPLTEFLLAGGSAKCLSLALNETMPTGRGDSGGFPRRVITLEGHLIDSGLMARVMDIVTENGGSFETLDFRAGLRRDDTSFVRLAVMAPSAEQLDRIVALLVERGAQPEDLGSHPPQLVEVEKDGVAPEDFYGTTIFPTDVLVDGHWVRATGQRMDGVLVVGRDTSGKPTVRVTLMRDLRKGEMVVVGSEGLRVNARIDEKGDEDEFQFMSSAVSSERRVEVAVESIAWDMLQLKRRAGKIVLVAGPVAVHTGGVDYLCELVRRGYIQALLGGNAIAVHDIERSFFGTSLGVDLQRGTPVHGGHRHHLMAINRIRRAGSIPEAVRQGVLTSGFMYELVKHNVPFSLAGSIRDDGPLPDTRMDLIEAQREYARLLEGAGMVLMLSSMLHSIGTGNMTPAGVKIVCVDINTSVATKLADRGSVEAVPVVTDVGLFLNLLVRKLAELED